MSRSICPEISMSKGSPPSFLILPHNSALAGAPIVPRYMDLAFLGILVLTKRLRVRFQIVPKPKYKEVPYEHDA